MPLRGGVLLRRELLEAGAHEGGHQVLASLLGPEAVQPAACDCGASCMRLDLTAPVFQDVDLLG